MAGEASAPEICEPCDGPEKWCACHKQRSGLEQSLTELEFSRSACSAALIGDARRLQQILDNGSSHCARDSTGYTPLHYAARAGHTECVSILIRSSACIDARTAGGATALHRAAFTGQSAVCLLLLRARADASIQDSDGHSPLHKAAAQQHIQTVRTLFTVGRAHASLPETGHVIS